LQHKRHEIVAAIARHQGKRAQARADPAHVTAAIAFFERSGLRGQGRSAQVFR
jgi:hypothetical protein